MAFVISSEDAELFKRYLRETEPYPLQILDELMFDDKRYEEGRLLATSVLKLLLNAGYSQEDVNPWMKKEEE